MATNKNASTDVTDFVSSFQRKRHAAPDPPEPAQAPAPEPEAITAPEAATQVPSESPVPLPMPPAEAPVESQKQKGKKKQSSSVQGVNSTYADTFLKPVVSKKNKAIYVDQTSHNALSVLSQAADIGLADIIINVLNHHFETYGPDIRTFLNEMEKRRKGNLPY
ncbi:DUF3408 domain-containing protein [Hymenobacter cavernae]|uniref:DUF3408 domain-containing protein n=1 Tax=Hymenobacter cavernae TaxID=2044852 RepID=A0ABQ1UWT6_9BACT|nr:DUF3408 domain-containing protein [Hymenobacter cavernae]GGF27220.1 hypothetical protein GCM10011383_43570 [Hymenobacter cavernae]